MLHDRAHRAQSMRDALLVHVDRVAIAARGIRALGLDTKLERLAASKVVDTETVREAGAEARANKLVACTQATRAQLPGRRLDEQRVAKELGHLAVVFGAVHEAQTHHVAVYALAKRVVACLARVR